MLDFDGDLDYILIFRNFLQDTY